MTIFPGIQSVPSGAFVPPPDGTDVPRDSRSRPLIVPPDGDCPVPYTRTSRLSGMLDPAPGLALWQARNVALGVARNPDIAAIVGQLEYGDERLDALINDVMEREHSTVKANWGTAVHVSVEDGRRVAGIPDSVRSEEATYRRLLNETGISLIESELFCVNDRLRCAGTLDGLYALPSSFGVGYDDIILGEKVVVGDLKTGHRFQPIKWAIQIAVYAQSLRYDPETHERSELHDNIVKEVGIVIHIPSTYGTGESVKNPGIYLIDLEFGYYAAQVCSLILAHGSGKRSSTVRPVPTLQETCELCAAGAHACVSCGAQLTHGQLVCPVCSCAMAATPDALREAAGTVPVPLRTLRFHDFVVHCARNIGMDTDDAAALAKQALGM